MKGTKIEDEGPLIDETEFGAAAQRSLALYDESLPNGEGQSLARMTAAFASVHTDH
jgi:hypothetical protein